MSGRRAHFEKMIAERDLIPVAEQSIRIRRSSFGANCNLAPQSLLQEPRTRDVIGMNMRLKRPQKLEVRALV